MEIGTPKRTVIVVPLPTTVPQPVEKPVPTPVPAMPEREKVPA